jgi:colanic acid/amylovoran biosynthesis glycosyltransferase
MRIGYVVTDFPVFSETFIQREAVALGRAGHRVFLYADTYHSDPLTRELETTRIRVSVVPFRRDARALERAARADGVEHLHSSLMVAAHRAAWPAARALQVPVTFRTYAGHDLFTLRDAKLYRAVSADPLFGGFIAEDAFMRDWLVERFGVDASRVSLVPNSLDLTLFARRPAPHDGVVILAIARFVEKKGLIHLVEAFTRLARRRPDVRLTLVGRGPEEPRLRRAAAGNPRIEFPGAVPASDTLAFYAGADIFCLPCVRAGNGDADGIPTTVLEAMACELPVVTSDLLSIPCYLTDGREGLLTAPGDVEALEMALERLCDDAALRRTLGAAARARVSETCDLDKNTVALAHVFADARRRLWRSKLAELERQRDTYPPERERYYVECRKRAIAYFRPQAGRLLDIGCDQGKFRLHLPGEVTYHGCDVLTDPRVRGAFPFVAARAEALPYRDGVFDGAVLFSVLPHVLDVDAVLAEAARVLKPGGHLYLQECYNDGNPIHINHLSDLALHQRVGEHFRIVSSEAANEYLMWMVALREDGRAGQPLVSIGITAYNRSPVIRRCVESALRQTHAAVEVVVVDDGSSDGTTRILEDYGSAVRLVRHDRNLGRVAAKNDALRATSPSAAYVALLDSDDYYHPRFVERTVEFLQTHAMVGLVYTDDVLVDGSGRELCQQQSVDPWDLDVWLRTRNLRGDTWLARRELVMRTALMDPEIDLDEDYDLFYQLLEITTFGHLPEHLVYITRNTGQTPGYLSDLARCHAANLVKYGHSSEYAYHRARINPEWAPAIEQGIALGRARRNWRARASASTAAFVLSADSSSRPCDLAPGTETRLEEKKEAAHARMA